MSLPAVRPATSADLPLLPELEAAADEPFRAIGMWPLPPPAGVDELRTARRVLVAGDPPVGFARVEEVDGAAHLEQLSVHPGHARRGIGGRLLYAACALACSDGHSAMTLITFRDVGWNAPFYARHGFRVVDGLTPGLVALRRHERQLGLDALGPRVVLRRHLDEPASSSGRGRPRLH